MKNVNKVRKNTFSGEGYRRD